jgi:hypothetical protein
MVANSYAVMRVTRRRRVIYGSWSAVLCALLLSTATGQTGQPQQISAFAAEIARLSEGEGSFDTDNLISNERDYLRVIPALVAGRVVGGVYLGVGPDQNFSYIARIRPTRAYIVDIRRDNLLLHLLFKALFAVSGTRVEYLCNLTGRVPPGDSAGWASKSIDQIAALVDEQEPRDVDKLRSRVDVAIAAFGMSLSDSDFHTIDRFHRTFTREALSLQFTTFGRPPQPYYPTLRQLLLATDESGHRWNYLASENDFQFVKSLHAHDAIIPVVGDLGGTHAMPLIAQDIARNGDWVSAFYVSNVESYLFGTDHRSQFLENIRRLPTDSRSVIIRSSFSGSGASTSVVAPLAVGSR